MKKYTFKNDKGLLLNVLATSEEQAFIKMQNTKFKDFDKITKCEDWQGGRFTISDIRENYDLNMSVRDAYFLGYRRCACNADLEIVRQEKQVSALRGGLANRMARTFANTIPYKNVIQYIVVCKKCKKLQDSHTRLKKAKEFIELSCPSLNASLKN